jgi:catechol 2,3-dioxygenase-like lactoylglutathione lyase family enzyme
MPPTLANGKICYIEIPAADIRRSADFYAKVFGWRIRQRGDGSTAFDDARVWSAINEPRADHLPIIEALIAAGANLDAASLPMSLRLAGPFSDSLNFKEQKTKSVSAGCPSFSTF